MMHTMICVLLLAVVSVVVSVDPCSEIPTCESCVNVTFCGWCSEFVVFENGQRGRNCAYQGPGAARFVCPKEYQTEPCANEELYVCNNATFQCVPTTNGGTLIEDCVNSCFPPTYTCNERYGTCELAEPGVGNSLEVCSATCGNSTEPLYACQSSTLECVRIPSNHSGGTTYDVCEDTCGQANNNTPAFINGIWRGVQINVGYKEGEWKMIVLQDNAIMIEDPSGSVWSAGELFSMQTELWIENPVGIQRGIFSVIQQPTVMQMVFAIGNPGETVPNNFDFAMQRNTPASVFVFWKCLGGSICDFTLDINSEMKRRFIEETPVVQAEVVDACSQHPDCASCTSDRNNSCGWCDVNVWYRNGTIEGSKCAGHNADGTRDPFVCNSIYSTQTCEYPTDIEIPTTSEGNRYKCNIHTSTCELNPQGEFEYLVDCQQDCVKVPTIPLELIGTWRGIEIRDGYVVGEWRVEIESQRVAIVNPTGSLSIGTIRMIGQNLIMDFQQGPIGGIITSIYQLTYSPNTRNLAWTWGPSYKDAPASWQDGLKKPNNQFVLVACEIGRDESQCGFSF